LTVHNAEIPGREGESTEAEHRGGAAHSSAAYMPDPDQREQQQQPGRMPSQVQTNLTDLYKGIAAGFGPSRTTPNHGYFPAPSNKPAWPW
jgi:hypothetical protein